MSRPSTDKTSDSERPGAGRAGAKRRPASRDKRKSVKPAEADVQQHSDDAAPAETNDAAGKSQTRTPKRAKSKKTTKTAKKTTKRDSKPAAGDSAERAGDTTAATPTKPRTRKSAKAAGSKPSDSKPVGKAKPAGKASVAERGKRASGFAELGLDDELLQVLARVGFDEPTDIQRALIPEALSGRDCLGQARTGTGKTAAFTLPILQTVEPGAGLQALIVVPTRELAAQVGEQVELLSPDPAPRTLVVYGGTRLRGSMAKLKRGVDILVATPGRLLDLRERGAVTFKDIRVAVLDEVDRMLDIGFRDDIYRIMKDVPQARQTIFVSATIDDDIRKLAQGLMRDQIEINVSADRLTVDEITQHYVSVDQRRKFEVLREFLSHSEPPLAIVFTRTKRGANTLARKLRAAELPAAEIHGDLPQHKRTKVLGNLRAGKLRVLVATDLAARGLDVTGISHIVNYDIPDDPSVYVHRIGRTARMGKQGFALTLVTPEQGRELTEIEMLINRELEQLGEDGFQPKAAPQPKPEDSAEPKSRATFVSQHAAPARSEAATPEREPPQRTLGGRFPVRRRRR